ncbi:relaxase/mobilization nuclease domain-containing protein [Mucilaginibacter sp. SJ]|uniref:relaxase/mobilization nuclease domain-containing protein n=1 Tax=Mucilaginibacter sp. SJ TaxID=3029053 RepID=UPI0023A91FEF|nr:relaxase/mobilization nuclease domain-containing protein [Mucilaginibacter sp. SJ]WEA01736.1 relaxase/mobilization nuclease domain-containing protein [Mucilaginibacter sp. SJ]
MIVKILKPVNGFPGVRYNTNKVERNKGELLKIANFGPLQGLTGLRPQDYINYLKLLSAQNKRVSKPQFHAVISAKGATYNKQELMRTGQSWLEQMGFGAQPYLIVFHKDTDNNHIHLVSTRVDREGKKINSAYEKLRAIDALQATLGYKYGMQYRFSTVAQFYLLLEKAGFEGRDMNLDKLGKRIAEHRPDRERANAIRQILLRHQGRPDLSGYLSEQHRLDLIFHAAPGRAPYGYTIIDHETMQVFKGSEVLSLRELRTDHGELRAEHSTGAGTHQPAITTPGVWIANDVDDEAVLGRNRRKKKKARTNTR